MTVEVIPPILRVDHVTKPPCALTQPTTSRNSDHTPGRPLASGPPPW